MKLLITTTFNNLVVKMKSENYKLLKKIFRLALCKCLYLVIYLTYKSLLTMVFGDCIFNEGISRFLTKLTIQYLLRRLKNKAR